MSLAAWITIYVVEIVFFGWMLRRDRELEKESSRLAVWLFLILIFSGWFVTGLIYPETRLFIFAQHD